MPIDWVATAGWMQAWGSFAGAGAIIYAAHKGAETFSSWKYQRIEERRIAAAEQILTLVYRLRRSLNEIRKPEIHIVEFVIAEDQLRQQPGMFWDRMAKDERERFANGQAITNRIEADEEDWLRIFERMPIARAFFGKETEECLLNLWNIYSDLSKAAQASSWDTGEDAEFHRRINNALFERPPGVLDEVAESFEELGSPHRGEVIADDAS